MFLSHLCPAIRQRRGPKGDVHKPGKQILKLELSVEPVSEFGQVTGKVLLPNGMICSVKDVLDIAPQGLTQRKWGF